MRTPSRIGVVLVTFVGVVLIGAGSAMAEAPTTWANPKPVSHLHDLVLFGGSTVGLIVVLTLFALVTSRKNYTPPPPGSEIQAHSGSSPDTHSTH